MPVLVFYKDEGSQGTSSFNEDGYLSGKIFERKFVARPIKAKEAKYVKIAFSNVSDTKISEMPESLKTAASKYALYTGSYDLVGTLTDLILEDSKFEQLVKKTISYVDDEGNKTPVSFDEDSPEELVTALARIMEEASPSFFTACVLRGKSISALRLQADLEALEKQESLNLTKTG